MPDLEIKYLKNIFKRDDCGFALVTGHSAALCSDNTQCIKSSVKSGKQTCLNGERSVLTLGFQIPMES